MCVTNIYTDRYPDGKEVQYRHTSVCEYGSTSRPCAAMSVRSNPVRKINFGEASTQYIMTQFPSTPPRSPRHSHSGAETSDDGSRHRREETKRRSDDFLHPLRHRKERIVIVDAPPTPMTPPRSFTQTFTAPSSPATPPFPMDEHVRRGRPIIVDERPLRRRRNPSVGAVIGERSPRRSTSSTRPFFGWESPSSSHASFDSRLRREEEEEARRREMRAKDKSPARSTERSTERPSTAEKTLEQKIAEQDDEIRRRPAIPIPIPRRSQTMRPILDQSDKLPESMASLSLEDRIKDRAKAAAVAEKRRKDEREHALRMRLEAQEEEALRQRLRERQMPRRRFSVGPGFRRHRVVYDDGVYRWE